jgi:uncharacterized protein DUF3306
MTVDRKRPEPFSLRRWSQRKLAAGRVQAPPGSAAHRSRADEREGVVGPPESASPASGAMPAAAPAALVPSSPGRASPDTAPALPPIESLTIDSDFSPFMRPGVDESVRRSALRKLLRDPRFNVMDGLDVYIDDYSKPSPIEPEIVRTLVQARYLFDPPQTRVNDAGCVEDVSAEAMQARQAVEASAHDVQSGEAPPHAEPASSQDADAEVAGQGSANAGAKDVES